MIWKVSVTYEIEADSHEEAEVVWEEDGPEIAETGRISLVSCSAPKLWEPAA